MKKDNQRTVYEALQQAGQQFGLGDFGTYAMNSMRLEKGFRGWGAEVYNYFVMHNLEVSHNLTWGSTCRSQRPYKSFHLIFSDVDGRQSY